MQVQVKVPRHADAVARPEKGGVAEDKRGREEAFAQEALRTVEVSEDEIEECGALFEAGFDVTPFIRRDHQWHHVQFPGPIHALRIAIDVVRDAMLADDPAAVFPANRQFVASEFFE